VRAGLTIPPGRCAGFTYLGLMLTVLLMTSAMAAVGGVWELGYRREKEVELLFIGNQFRRALAGYYKDGTNDGDRYPRQLADLMKDPRVSATRRYLRKLYADPVSGTKEWGLLRNANGGIIGVFSLSENKPLKKANFRKADEGFAKKEKYKDWVFVYQPGSTSKSAATGTQSATAATPQTPNTTSILAK
jgi:hypothetical protein